MGVLLLLSGRSEAFRDSDVERFYRFTGEDLSNQFFRENVYYRLREVDLDGRWQFSGIIVVRRFDAEDNKLTCQAQPICQSGGICGTRWWLW